MNIILLENIEKVGLKYEVVTVKPGYGRNYLIPQGLALTANKQNLGKLSGIKRQQAAKDNAQLETFKKWAAALEGKTVRFVAKAGDSGRLFGSITAAMVAEKLAEFGAPVERRRVIMPAEVKMLGSYEARLDLHPSLDVRVPFDVVSEADEKAYRAAAPAPAPVAAPEPVEAAAPTVTERIAEKVEEMAAPVMAAAAAPVAFVEDVAEKAADATESAVESVKEFAAPVVETVSEAAESAMESVKEAAAPVMETVSEAAESVMDKVEDVAEEVAEEVSEAIESVKEFFSGKSDDGDKEDDDDKKEKGDDD